MKNTNNDYQKKVVNDEISSSPKWINSEKSKKKIINRIRTIKGHLAGIEHMIEEGQACDNILIQVSAVKSSVHKVGIKILEEYALNCLMPDKDVPVDKQKMEKAINTLISYVK